MKIYEGIFPPKIDTYHRPKGKDLKERKGIEPSPKDMGEGVSVSEVALELGRTICNLGTEDCVRNEKIAPIIEGIQKGGYRVDEREIAKEMIKDALLKARIVGE
ncbi:MAG: flagellar biosynthesis anti-sigma factor FlgM [Desulfatiglandales bacterium]